jgi:hypothetical protein
MTKFTYFCSKVNLHSKKMSKFETSLKKKNE